MEMPVYYELSWSILSTIGLFLTFVGTWAILITRFSTLYLVPVIVSVACAISNGLCYYVFYAQYSNSHRIAASAFADVFWLIQEAGLSFYSYQILFHTLRDQARVVFLSLFWTLMVIIIATRTGIIVTRAIEIAHNASLQKQIDYLHIGYFILIAQVETCSAFFLIRLLGKARTASPFSSPTRHIFRYLLHTTEVRLASLCCIGIVRAVTYSLQTSGQSATTIAGQLDRFAYTLECLYPIVMITDYLASKKVLPENHTVLQYH